MFLASPGQLSTVISPCISVRLTGPSCLAAVFTSFSFETSAGPWTQMAWSCGLLWGLEGEERIGIMALTQWRNAQSCLPPPHQQKYIQPTQSLSGDMDQRAE